MDKDQQEYQDYLDYQKYQQGSYSLDAPSVKTQEPSVNQLLGNPATRGQKAIRAGAGQVIKSIPFGVGDEIFGAAGAGYDYLRGKGNTYNQRVEQARDWENAASKTSPIISGVGEVASNIAIPIKSAVGARGSVLGKTAQAGLEGGAQGAAFGFADGQGSLEERLKSAKDSALLGAGTSGGLTGIAQSLIKTAKPLRNTGQALNRKSIGARQSDYAKTANDLQTIELPDGDLQTLTRKTLDELLDSGELGKSRDPQSLVKVTRKKSQDLAIAVDDVIQANNKSVPLDFKEAEFLLNQGSIPADKVKLYRNKLKNIKKTISTEGQDKLSYLQQQKVALGKSYKPDDTALNEFNRAIYKDLQKTIEQHAPEVKGLNRELQKYKIAGKIVERSLAKSETTDAATGALQLLRTSGGIGVPLLAGAYAGNPLLGGAGGVAVHFAQKPAAKRIAAELLGNSSKLNQNLGKYATENSGQFARAALALRGE